MRKKRLLWQLFVANLWAAVAALFVFNLYRFQWMRTYYLDVAAWALALGGLVLLSLWLSRRINRPLQEMAEAAQRFAEGDLDHRLPPSVWQETTALAEAMNRMAGQLDERIRTILRQQNEQEAMLISMDEGVLAVDNNSTIINLNEACARMLQIDSSRVRGRLVHEVLRKPELLAFVEASLDSDEPVERDLRIHGSRDQMLRAHGTMLHDSQQKKIGALIVLHDLTRLHHLENVRRDFVANVSHELRTPITSIKGFVETLLDGAMEDPENRSHFLQIVLRQVNRLNSIIEDLLVLSRIERGSEQQLVQMEWGCLREVLVAALEMCGQKSAEKGVAVVIHCEGELEAAMNAHLLEQAVINLVDNAIKYSPPGTTVQVVGERDEDALVIRVRDEGAGIEASHLPRLFERFYRVDKARSRELGGTGLGLAIVRHIALAHRGSVSVSSVVRGGSVFTIRLPLAMPVPIGSDEPRFGDETTA